VRRLINHAEDLLEIAFVSENRDETAAIVLERAGGFRMLDAAGWSLPALKDEFGATAVFKVEKRGPRVRVEAWDGRERCLLERSRVPFAAAAMPAANTLPQPFFPAL
jgi:hypothetical protein